MITGMWTVWGTDPETKKEIWYWHPPQVLIKADPIQLRAEQWTPIDPEHQHTLFLTLLGQLAEVRYLKKTAPAEQVEAWIRQEDFTYAKQTPVVLAFYLPEHVRAVTQQTSVQGQNLSSNSLPLLLGETLAPTHIGEVALVADTHAEGWRPYSLHVLGEEGRALQRQIQQMIADFEAEARTERRRERAGIIALTSYHLAERQERYQRLHTLAQQLAALYLTAHQEKAQHITNTSPLRSLPETPYVVDIAALIPTPQPVQAILAAYSHAQSGMEGWDRATGIPTFVYSKEDGTTRIEFRPSDPDVQLDDATIKSLWHQVRQLSDIDGDVLLAMLAQAIATPHDAKDGVWITGKLILDYRGIKPIIKREKGRERKAGYRQEDLAEVAACASRMSNTWIRVEQWIADDTTTPPELQGKRSKKRQQTYLYTRESRLINISDIIRQHELHREPRAVSGQTNLMVAWRYQLGSWIDPFLQGANRQVAWLLQQALSYDPYHEMWEKRLARYFTFHMRINATKGGVTIAREIGQLIEELSLRINQRDPERTRQRFEKSMNRLEEDTLISGWGYQEDNPPLPARKWLEPWLKQTIWVTVAPIPLETSLHGPAVQALAAPREQHTQSQVKKH